MTLIEVLVAILIFSFGLLGLAGLQARALRYSSSAEDTNRASLLANQMSFMMVDKNQLDQPTNYASDYAAWQGRVTAGLPNGVGTVAVVATGPLATITITWRSPNALTTDPLNRYVTQVVLP